MFNIFIMAFMQIINLLTRRMYLRCINVYSNIMLSYCRQTALQGALVLAKSAD